MKGKNFKLTAFIGYIQEDKGRCGHTLREGRSPHLME
jgi:hypothetical protein